MTDGRPIYLCYPRGTTPDDTYEARVLCCSRTLKEAREDARMFGGAAIYVCDHYARPQSEGGDYADNERFVEEIANG